MKKLNVLIDDDLMTRLKIHAVTNKTTIKEIVAEALETILDYNLQSNTKEKVVQTSSNYTSGIDWGEVAKKVDEIPENDEEFYYETRIDEDGNEYKVRLVRPESLYGKVEHPDEKYGYQGDEDEISDIERKLRQMEEEFK